MSVCRLVAGLVGLALAAVVVTVLVALGGEVRAELAPAVVNEDSASAAPAFSSGCVQAPWPYGCQWRSAPAKRIVRAARPT
jgi:hypothetical protein